jgi:hypothetical protein
LLQVGDSARKRNSQLIANEDPSLLQQQNAGLHMLGEHAPA